MQLRIEMVPNLHLLDSCNHCSLQDHKCHYRMFHISISNHLASTSLHIQMFQHNKCMGQVLGNLVGRKVGRMAGRMVGRMVGRTVGKRVGKTVERKVGNTAGKMAQVFHN